MNRYQALFIFLICEIPLTALAYFSSTLGDPFISAWIGVNVVTLGSFAVVGLAIYFIRWIIFDQPIARFWDWLGSLTEEKSKND